MRVGAVVLNHGNWPEVGSTIRSLLEQTRPLSRIVLVDNASELPADQLEAAFPEVELIRAARNLGYAGGMNLGITSLRGGSDAYLLVTHDCLADPDLVAGLAGHLERRVRVGIAAPRLVYRSAPEVLWGAGGGIDPGTWEPFRYGWGERSDDWASKEPMSVAWVDGACWVIRATTFEDVGPLDEDFFLYYEETTYCFDVRAHGWDVVCLPALRAQQEPSEVPYYLQVRNWLRFVSRTAPVRQLSGCLRAVLRDAVRRVREGERRIPLAQVAGMVAFLLRRYGPPPRFLQDPRSSIQPPSDESP